MIRVIRTSFVCLAAALLVGAPLAAEPTKTPVITSAIADGSTLFIEGSNFGNAPSVTLGGFPLGGVIVNSLGTQLQANLPAMDPGAYQLQVINGNNKCVFELTIGAQGPAGPTGADGASGPPGADGPTGPTGPTGPQGVMGINGVNGATGATGPTGPPGTSGILAIHPFQGSVGTVDITGGDYSFLGPTVNVAVGAGQRVTGAASAALGKTAAGSVVLAIGLCYKGPSDALPVNFVGFNYVAATFDGVSRHPYSASASAVFPAAATYAVGLCAAGTATLNSNDYVNGWVMVSQ